MEINHPTHYHTPITRFMRDWDAFLNALATLSVGFEILREGEIPMTSADSQMLEVWIKIYDHKIDRLVAHNVWQQVYKDKGIEAL